MNDKLRHYVNILFAAAPKTAKAEEIKEELLTNLNEKYNDLLANGYDSTAAFHIALSGIGDIDELFKECGEPNETPSAASAALRDAWKRLPNSLWILLAVLLFLLPLGLMIYLSLVSNNANILINDDGIRFPGVQIDREGIALRAFPLVFGSSVLFLCWAVGIGLIIYVIVRSARNSKNETATAACWEPGMPGMSPTAPALTQRDIAFKRTVAGILGILLGTFGVHKFYLGFVGTGLIMLLITVLSCGSLAVVTWTIGIIEGIVYLFKSDGEFYRDYEIIRRNWF